MTHRQGRAVVIDDDPVLCNYFQRHFRRSGIDLRIAPTGSEGLEAVRLHQPDIVLLDVNLPDKDGIALCRELKADGETAHIPVIILTALGDAYVRAFQAGATDCVIKPVRALELEARIYNALRKNDFDASRESGTQCQHRSAAVRKHADEQHRLNQAIAEMDHVLGIVGHELRTPLAGLRVMSEYLLTDTDVSGKPHEFIQAIHDETIRLSGMVNNLLEAARINSGSARWQWGAVPVQKVCEAAIALIRPLASQEIRLISDVQPNSMTMLGDGDAIRRLLLNLLSNAQKHTDNGTISVHARNRLDAAGRWIELTVADTGRGIPPEMTEDLGVPFALNQGVVENAVGTGLGISICNSIAAAHGGRLSFNSKLGEGTIVTALLRADLPQPALGECQPAIREVAA